MKERIKALRKALGVTQQEFADSLKIKRNTVANYETGRNDPIDAVISLICTTYGVNDVWIRTGEGEMFVPYSRDQEISAFVGRVLKGEDDNFKRRLLRVLARLDESEWVLLERRLREIVGEGLEDDKRPEP